MFVSDIAIFVLKRDVKLQLTNLCYNVFRFSYSCLVMAALWYRIGLYIFPVWFLSFFFFFIFLA